MMWVRSRAIRATRILGYTFLIACMIFGLFGSTAGLNDKGGCTSCRQAAAKYSSVSDQDKIGVYFTPAYTKSSDKCRVDLLFAVDTSGSMLDEWVNLCDIITNITNNVTSDYNLKAHIIAIGGEAPEDISCNPEVWMAQETCQNDSSGQYGQWGPAVAYWAEQEAWRNSSTRIIVPISDEGPLCGCDNGSIDQYDNDSIEAAIIAANDNHVLVCPLQGMPDQNSSLCDLEVIALMDHLANETRGQRFSISGYSQMETAIKTIIADNCVGLNQPTKLKFPKDDANYGTSCCGQRQSNRLLWNRNAARRSPSRSRQ